MTSFKAMTTLVRNNAFVWEY